MPTFSTIRRSSIQVTEKWAELASYQNLSDVQSNQMGRCIIFAANPRQSLLLIVRQPILQV